MVTILQRQSGPDGGIRAAASAAIAEHRWRSLHSLMRGRCAGWGKTGMRSSHPFAWVTLALLVASPPVQAAEGLDDQAAGKAAARCHAAITKAGASFANTTLQKLGQCTTSVLKCIRARPDDERCRNRAAAKCAKTLEKLEAQAKRVDRTIGNGCRRLDPADLLDTAGLGYEALATECQGLDGSATVAECVRAQHRCAAEKLLSAAQPRAYEALGVVDAALPASTCLQPDSSAGTTSPPELAKALKRCDKALAQAAGTFAAQELASRQKCLAGLVACVQRRGGDAACVAAAAPKCGKLRTKREQQAAKFRATLAKKCGGVPFDALVAPTGADLESLASVCDVHGVDPTASLESYGACVVEHHRCRAEELLFFEAPRAAELLAEAGEPFGATCGATLVALPGGDLDVVFGDTVVLNAESRGGIGFPRYTWQLLEAPAGTAVGISDPQAARQVFVPDVTGIYRFSLVAEAAGRTSAPATVSVRVTAEPPPPVPVVAVADIRFTRAREGLVDPTSAIVLALDGPVDPASLTPETIRLETDDTAVPIDVVFDPSVSTVTVTPKSPLPLDTMFTLGVHDLTATENPFEFVPFEHPFLTPAAVTAIVEGQVLAPDRQPLEFVTVRIAGQETVTRPDGSFHFDAVPEGARRLEIDPSTVGDPIVAYTPLSFLLDVVAGFEPNTLGDPIVLTVVDQTTAIDFPGERILTSPVFPGLRVDFSGVTARNPTGTIFAGPITVSPVGPDDVPMPFPGASESFWTIQPGGLLLDPPAKVTVPLPIPMDEGEEIDLWAFDHAAHQWVAYGRGVVDAGGVTATSLPGEGLPFTGWHSVVTRREVVRDVGADATQPQLQPRETVPQPVAGTVVDAAGNALHGVLVEGGGDTAYTDYTDAIFNGSVRGEYLLDKVLVGYNVFVNGTFDHFEPRNPKICATATDLLLKQYRGCVTADVTANVFYDPSERDGNIIGIIGSPQIKLADYTVIDDTGDIHLHRDARNPNLRSHRIRWELHGTLVGNSQRYRDEVMAVTEKLASLGFREENAGKPFLEPTDVFERDQPPLARARCPVSAHYPGAAHRAVRLFEALWLHRGAGRVITSFEGKVDELVLQGLNDVDDVLWTPANAPAVQGLHGFPQEANSTRFIHPTVTKRLIAIRDMVGTTRLNSLTLPLGGDRGIRCDASRTLVHDYFHAVGSAVDFAWLQPSGAPGAHNFYRPVFDPTCVARARSPGSPVPLATCMRPITLLAGEVPDTREEWLQSDFATEAAAFAAGRTWATKSNYSRELTRAYVEAIKAQPNHADVIFNDPRIQAQRAAAHSNHIHAEFYYERGDFHPAGADGTPPFPRAVARAVGEDFTIVRVAPDDPQGVLGTLGGVIEVEFSAAVDPATLGPDSLQLIAYRTAEAIPVSIAVGASETGGPGTLAVLVPGDELPENSPIALAATERIHALDGSPLVLPDGEPIVAEFATALSSTITGAAFVGAPIVLTREDLSATRLAVLGSTDAGRTRPITDSMERFSLTHDSGRTLQDVVGDDGRLGRVLSGRSILRGIANNGAEAHALVDADLVASPTALNPVARIGEPLAVRFEEPVNVAALTVVGAEIVDRRNDRYPAAVAIAGDGQRVDATPTGTLPRYQDLRLETTVRVTDPVGETVDVVTGTTFMVVGVQAGDVDTDGDGLPDVVEDALGDCVDAAVPDTDGDGITDDLEDCDDDTLTNGAEANLGLNPGNRDTDGDGNLDPMELNLGCNPRAPETTIVVGRTVDQGAGAVAGVGVRALGRTATSNAAGTFAIPNVPACPGRTFRVAARLDGEPALEAVSASAASVLGGMTDVGDVVMLPVTKPLYPPAQFTGAGADYVQLVDVNDDGVLDAVAVSNTLSVLLGRGDGTFEPEQQFVLGGASPRFIEAADLNTDGKVDLVTCVTGGLSLLLGNGDGTFVDGQFIDISGNPNGAIAADMNGDMALDLVAASDGVGVVVLLGNGDGTFQPEQTFGNDRDQTDIAVGLFNDDAVLDVATSGRAFISSAIGEIVVLLGNGDGTLQAEQEFRTETDRVHALLAEDLDGDGELDLIAISPRPLGDGVSFGGSVLRGNGDGTFQPAEIFVTGTDSASAGGRMALGQFTPDENLDLVIANDFLDLSLVPGNGDATFQAPISIPRGLVPDGVAVGDLNGDGLTDIVNTDTFDQQLWSLLGHGDGTFEVAGQTRLEVLFESGSGTARRFATADFDGDGNLDLVAAGHRRRLSVALGKGDFFFQPHFGLEALPMDRFDRTTDVVAGNFDAGDTVDVVALAGQEVVAFLGNGDGTFGQAIPTSLGVGEPGVDAEELEAAHLNGDGNLDLVATLGFDDQVATLLGNGDGTFQPPLLLTGMGRPIGLAVADLENDGAADVIVAPFQSVGLGIYRGNGDGTFAPVRFVGEHQYIQVAAVDVNADTITDLVASGYPLDGNFDHAAFVFVGNGDGTFQREQLYEADVCPEGLTSADLTGDDLPDFVTANCGANNLSLFVANGDGTFQPQVKIGVGQPDQLTAADLDGDGAPDLIVGTEFVDVGILPHR
jgi:hypothetical protein